VWGDLHGQISTSHHDAVTLLEDGVEVCEALLVLYLGDDAHVKAARLIQHTADVAHVVRVLHEGGCHEVHPVLAAELLEVLHVLGGQHGDIHLGTWQVHVLASPQLLGVQGLASQLLVIQDLQHLHS